MNHKKNLSQGGALENNHGSVRSRTLAAMALAMGLLFIPSLSVAASFDCAKAATKVEKRICANPELSRLDEQLARAYEQTLKQAKDPAALKAAQRQWLKGRNACAEDACVKQAYEQRLAALSGTDTSNKLATHAKYPPYPEVWDRLIPEPREAYVNALTFGKAKDGDFVILYGRSPVRRPEDLDTSVGTLSFFGGDHVQRASRKDFFYEKTLPVSVVLTMPPVGETRLSLDTLEHRQPQRCPQHLNGYMTIKRGDGRPPEKKALLYVLDKPIREEVDPLCADTSERSFWVKVVSLQGGYVPLEDGTFLVQDGYAGVVVRFDPNLETRSSLMNRRIFWVDASELRRYRREEGIDYQKMQDEVLMHLQTRKEMKP